jgi:hypothetical protein
MVQQNKPISFYFDLDEVIIQQSYVIPSLIFGGIAQNPFNSFHYLASLLRVEQSYKRDADGIKEGLYDSGGQGIEGISYHFFEHGKRDPRLASYVPWLIQTMEQKRQFIEGTRIIGNYLKDKKGYTIYFATNKDRLSYDITAQTFGKPLTDLATKVFVAHPGNSKRFLNDLNQFAQETTTPENYKKLLQKATDIPESENIIHAPGRKPEKEYYQHMIKCDNSEIKVFVDDRKTNVEGFMKLQDTIEKTTLYGIHFKNPQQFAQELIKLGFLSEEEDQELLQKISRLHYYPRMVKGCCAFVIAGAFLLLLQRYVLNATVVVS